MSMVVNSVILSNINQLAAFDRFMLNHSAPRLVKSMIRLVNHPTHGILTRIATRAEMMMFFAHSFLIKERMN